MTRRQLERELASLADAERAKNLAWFFKTGKGEYGEGTRFLGIRVPAQRKVALRFRDLPLEDVKRLLLSPIHEHRFVAAEILVAKYERAPAKEADEIFRFYLSHAKEFNNWDLVDTSAPYIVGQHLKTRPRRILNRLVKSENLWERRIAIVATLALIKAGETAETYRVAERLLGDRHDLIHKATGWALREAGRVSREELLGFLERHYQRIPRTALRYAIEHFAPEERRRLRAGTFPFNEQDGHMKGNAGQSTGEQNPGSIRRTKRSSGVSRALRDGDDVGGGREDL